MKSRTWRKWAATAVDSRAFVPFYVIQQGITLRILVHISHNTGSERLSQSRSK